MQNKFSDPFTTAKGETRAFVDFEKLDWLWFNTGTICNLTCQNCYIESSPINDRLVYLTLQDVQQILHECEQINQSPKVIGFTGGEPFINPYFMDIVEYILKQKFDVLILTNAMKPMKKCYGELQKLIAKYGDKLHLRISLDHYSQQVHEAERGAKTWKVTLEGIDWLASVGADFSIAGRSLLQEDEEEVRQHYQALFDERHWKISAENNNHLTLFSEMNEEKDVPEITTACWDILNKKPEQMMCANSRMVVKEKGSSDLSIIACTLLPYDAEFNLGSTIEQSMQRVQLNHPYCAQFCVLGGCSCEG